MMLFDDCIFRRRFSQNLYRNLSLPIAGMFFYKDWINDKRGDPYPIISQNGQFSETVLNGIYSFSSDCGGTVCRLIGSFFPYATYEMTFKKGENASAGFSFTNDSGFSLTVLTGNGKVHIVSDETELGVSDFDGDTLSVTFRKGGLSVYSRCENEPDRLVTDVSLPSLDELLTSSSFRRTRAGVLIEADAKGSVSLTAVRAAINSGISQADIKPIRYENGEVLIENGRIFLTASARQQKSCYQIVLSWCPTTSDFRLEGVLFYDCGDGKWSNDVALSLIYDRRSKKWIYWMCAFSHGHILGRGTTENDPRFGINLLSVELMKTVGKEDSLNTFAAFSGDEDPDLIFHEGKWYLTICRLEKDGYHYHRFVSDNPLDGFSWQDRTLTGEKTGGLFAPVRGDLYFICGSDFHKRSVYDVYAWNDFSSCTHLKSDFDDGGFRGWGTVMELPCGFEKRVIWITFDRHNGSSFNWSYGNIYVFDLEEK